MIIRSALLVLLSFTSCLLTFGQSYKIHFDSLSIARDTAAQKALLAKWETLGSKDSDFYIATFNYFTDISRQHIVRIGDNPANKDHFMVMDPDDEDAEPLAYMFDDFYFDDALFNKGIDYIDQGIALYPTRLDMRLGKIYMLLQAQRMDAFAIEIESAIACSVEIDNQWTWSPEKPYEDERTFFLDVMQSYQYQIFESEDPSILHYVERIAQSLLNYYPDNVPSITNIAVMALYQGDFKQSIELLERALEIDPTDYIVYGNLAYVYSVMGDHDNAIKAYEKVIEFGNEEARQFAKVQIEILKQNR